MAPLERLKILMQIQGNQKASPLLLFHAPFRCTCLSSLAATVECSKADAFLLHTVHLSSPAGGWRLL